MRSLKRLLLVLVALTLGVTAAPAAAREWGESFRGGYREERRESREQERREHERWEHRRFRHFGFVFPALSVAPYCYAQGGYWAWDGWQYVWAPPQTVCQ